MNKKKKIILAVVFLLVAVIVWSFAAKAITAKEVEVETLKPRRLSQEVSVIGNVKAKSEEEIILSTQQKVEKIFAVEGQEIKKNDTIVTVDATDFQYQLNKHKLNLDLASANYDEAKKRFDQYKLLYENKAISKQQYEDFAKQMNDQKIQIESAKLEIQNARDKIYNSEIKANINGTIVRLDIKENQYPTSENCSIIIYDLSQYKIVVEANQYDAAKISRGQKAIIIIKGLDREYVGTVSQIDEAAKIDLANKRAKVKIEITFDNPDNKIKAGYEADVNIILLEIPGALAVNVKAVQREKDGREFVFLLENGKAIKKYLKTGLRTDNYEQVIEGLSAGQQYIINPSEKLKNGDPVSTGEE